ncbi:MAG: metallophosphoesterase [Pseudomonadota bacterium]
MWWLLGTALGAFILYAWWIEPALRLRVQQWDVTSKVWRGPDLRIVILSDIHAGWPYVSLSRVRRIVDRANALSPDLAVNLGDLGSAHFLSTRYTKRDVVDALAHFKGALGTYYILGNHDWWQDREALGARAVPEAARALSEAGLSFLDNEAQLLDHGDHKFAVVGLGDQRPHSHDPAFPGFDDLELALSSVPADVPAILLAHEPDVFPDVPANVALVLSGHTHGGQVRFGSWAPFIRFSRNEVFFYGPYETKDGRKLVISGGIGCANVPARFGVPPEITVVTLRAAT